MHPSRALSIAVPIALAACSTLFTIRVSDEAQTTVPAGTVIEQLLVDFGFSDFVSMDLTQSSELRNQGVAPGDIEDVRMELLELEAVGPVGADLSFLESMEVYVEAPDLPRLLVASADAFPPGEALVVFDLEEVDLTPYVVSTSMSFDTEVTGHRPDEDTDVVARFEVAVGVTGQGACSATRSDAD